MVKNINKEETIVKIMKITRTSGMDFWGKFQCEHCGSVSEGRGYNDGYYKTNVLPFCKCPACKMQSIKGPVKVSYDGFKILEKKELPDDYQPPESYFSGQPKEEGWRMEDQVKNQPFLW